METEYIISISQKSRGTYSEIFSIRPLFFLCGPYLDENNSSDRREILRKYLGNLEINKEYQIKPYALVIDNLFPEIKTDMNLTLIEEIISVCSYKTFVFLDTMSTSLEMGLFVNSQNTNNVIALLPSDFMFFKPTIGVFVNQTIDLSPNINKIIYSNKRMNKYIKDSDGNVTHIEQNLISFKGKILPKSIINYITKSIYNLEDYKINLTISNDINSKKSIIFQHTGDRITFNLPTNILFFLVNKYHSLISIKNFLMEHLKNHYFYNFTNVPSLYYLYSKNRINVEIESSYSFKIEVVIKNIDYLIDAIESKKAGPQRFKNILYTDNKESYKYINFKFTDLFEFNPYDKNIILKYLKSPEKHVLNKILKINGKKRKIIMYKNNEYGYNLRKLHNKVVVKLSNLVELNNSAYAYRKQTNVVSCVSKHIESKYFLKLDIKEFFNSISKQQFKKVLKCVFSSYEETTYINNIVLHGKKRKYIYDSKIINNWENIDELVSLLFYNSRLPLGFTSSPLISNIYLNFFDKRINKKLSIREDLIYTRYADDILISSKNGFNHQTILKWIIDELSYLNLELNLKKTKFLVLSNIGDHIKYLGLNIVKREESNEITIGKKYIFDLLKQINIIKINNLNSEVEEVIGKINYIKSVSLKEYELFKSIYKLKNKHEFNINKICN